MKKIILILVLALGLSACAQSSGLQLIPPANNKEIGIPDFQFQPTLSCQIKISDNKDEIGKNLSFTSLDTPNPQVTYEGSAAVILDKVYDNNGRIIVQAVAGGNASVDTYLINKETGVFGKTSTGDFWGIYAMAAKGYCVGK